MMLTNLPYPRKMGCKNKKEYTLTETLYCDQWQVPAGTTVILVTTQNFGFCHLPKDCKDVRGFIIPRRTFRW